MIRQFICMTCLHDGVLSKTSVSCSTYSGYIFAKMLHTASAKVTFSAHDIRICAYLISYFQVLYILSDSFHHTGKFMSRYQRRLNCKCSGITFIYVYIRSAYSAVFYFNTNLVFFRFSDINFFYSNIFWTMIYRSLHRTLLKQAYFCWISSRYLQL